MISCYYKFPFLNIGNCIHFLCKPLQYESFTEIVTRAWTDFHSYFIEAWSDVQKEWALNICGKSFLIGVCLMQYIFELFDEIPCKIPFEQHKA